MTAIGAPLKRREDPKLLVGEAKYVDDIKVPGQLWMGMVRSPMAHAKIASIDTSEAETHQGVHAVYTGPQLQEMGLWIAPLPCAWPVTDDMVNPPHYPLAMDQIMEVLNEPLKVVDGPAIVADAVADALAHRSLVTPEDAPLGRRRFEVTDWTESFAQGAKHIMQSDLNLQEVGWTTP